MSSSPAPALPCASTCCRSAASSPPAPSASRAPPSRRRPRRRSTTSCRASPASTSAPTSNRNRAPQVNCMPEIAASRPASTILLLRDGAGVDGKSRDEVEVFMMVRHHQIEFNSGALVFPGSSVDAGDQEIVARSDLYSGGEGLSAADRGFRIAAIRETFEESGILLARLKGSTAPVDAKRAGEIADAHRVALNEHKVSFLSI